MIYSGLAKYIANKSNFISLTGINIGASSLDISWKYIAKGLYSHYLTQ